MTPDRWTQVESLFHAALARAPEERRAFLAEACHGDAELQEHVAALLAHDRTDASFIEAPAIEVAARRLARKGEDADDAPEAIDGRLGDFRILREIGRGGMGVVYEAEQISLKRRVALKVLPFAAALDERRLQRFKNEATAAAHLHHQHIVPVYSVGCERGVHYYAMQFIEGRTLAEVIEELRAGGAATSGAASGEDQTPALTMGLIHPEAGDPDEGERTLSPAAPPDTKALAALTTERSTRLGAFHRTVARLGVEAAEALEHAHEMGIVHRDIKPGNLLLDARGNIWIADFGLAQLQSGSGLTMTGDLLGTLRYMSPEQALAQRGGVDHRTDLYSLGATLYELLTLRPAFPGDDRQELLRRIAGDEPVAPRRISAAIPADLETIVLKAMAKAPEERYAAAQELADDLRRFLDDKPIRAKPPTLFQHAAKWARRRRAVVWSATVASLVVLLTAVTLLTISNVRIAKERNAKDEALRTARQNLLQARKAVDDYYTRVSENSLLQQPALEPLRQQLLQDALRYYQDFVRENADDPELQAELVAALLRVHVLQYELGQDWLPTLKQANSLVEKLLETRPDAGALGTLRDGMRSFNAVTILHVRDPAETLREMERSRSLWEQLAREYPAVAGFKNDLATIHLVIAALNDGVHSTEAVRSYERSAELWGQLVESGEAAPKHLVAQSITLSNLSVALALVGRAPEAEDALGRSAAIVQRLVADYPGVPAFQELLGYVDGQSGFLLSRTNRPVEAETAYRRMLATQNALAEQHPGVARYRNGVFFARMHLAELHLMQGRSNEAAAQFRELATLGEQLDPKDPRFQDLRAWTLANCPDPCYRDASQAIQIAQAVVQQVPQWGAYWTTLGAAHYYAGDDDAAIEALEESLSLPLHFRETAARLFLAMTYWRKGDQRAARRLYEEALQRSEEFKVKKWWGAEPLQLREEADALIEPKEL